MAHPLSNDDSGYGTHQPQIVIYGRNSAGSSGFYTAGYDFREITPPEPDKNRLTNPNFLLN
jgi:hypothetical protein